MAPEWRAKPSAPEAMTALVVSAEGTPLSTGRDLRIKVQLRSGQGR
jgi:type VI secretion system secreted protein VgrG